MSLWFLAQIRFSIVEENCTFLYKSDNFLDCSTTALQEFVIDEGRYWILEGLEL